MTEEEISNLIELVVNGKEPKDDDSWKSNPEFSAKGWCTYVGLKPGNTEVAEDSLWDAAMRLWTRKEMAIPKREGFSLLLQKRFKHNIYPDGTIGYYLRNQLPSIYHLSSPNSHPWHGCEPHTMKATSRGFVDQDYVGRLSDRDRLWLSKFNDEYYNNRFQNDDTDLHKTRDQKRERFRNTNYVNNDAYASASARKRIYGVRGDDSQFKHGQYIIERSEGGNYDPTDDIIEHIDDCIFADQFWSKEYGKEKD